MDKMFIFGCGERYMKKYIKILAIIAVVWFIGLRIIDLVNYYILDKGKWVVVGKMADNRTLHTVSLLDNGDVLVSGGSYERTHPYRTAIIKTAEIYHHKTGKFSKTGDMVLPRENHTSTTLKDGRVLITGGDIKWGGPATDRAEIYDPKTGKFTETGRLNVGRTMHRAILLNNGEVLILPSAFTNPKGHWYGELYDPKTGKFSWTGKTRHLYNEKQPILLPNGDVLLIEGWEPILSKRRLPSGKVKLEQIGRKYITEIYATKENKFIEGPEIKANESCAVTLLDSETILVGDLFGKGFLFNLKDKTTTPVKNEMDMGWMEELTKQTVLLDSGNVLILGPYMTNTLDEKKKKFKVTCYIYNKNKNEFIKLQDAKYPVSYTKAVKLKNGDVLLVGGTARIGVGPVPLGLKRIREAQLYKYKH